MKMRSARVVVTLAVDVLVPEGATLDVAEVGNSIERRVRVMRAHHSKVDALYVDGKVNPKYFEVDRVYVIEPQPVEVEQPKESGGA